MDSRSSGATLCGTTIYFEWPDGQRRKTTFGGIIKVVTSRGHIELYGLTVGHVLNYGEETSATDSTDMSDSTIPSGSSDQEEITDSQAAVTDSPTMTFEGFNAPTATENFLLDRCLAVIRHPTKSPTVKQSAGEEDIQDLPYPYNSDTHEGVPEEEWSVIEPTILGRVYKTSDQMARHLHDWTIFETSILEINRIPLGSQALLRLSTTKPGQTGSRSVWLVKSSGGYPSGQLLAWSAHLLLGHSGIFVETYLIKVDGMCDGDCGSWVVDSDTYEVYGHLVATDIFGKGYVVPCMAIFNDIKRCLGAESVGLPDADDILPANDRRAGEA
ncbi:hypothetical protein F4778DRAFT_799423 [Xylariomycetidae sp. FL2044]|nr:hypothetical protein F4778DRAFT_799423 [Xylariomycetidae sp. FL2044]